MRSVLLAAALGVVAFGACWTGAEVTATEPSVEPKLPLAERVDLRVRLERTQCFGSCPTYSVVIDGDGHVDWMGGSSVAVLGHRTGKVTHRELVELSHRLDRARFFERDDYGELPKQPECQSIGSTTTCSFGTSVSICSDTSHAIIRATRGIQTHRIDNDHCNDSPELDALEQYIDAIAHTEAWIAP